MDERDKGEDGWTFIVNYKPFRHQYPFSGKPMEILRDCPEITSFVIRNSGSTSTGVSAEAEATLLHGPARKFVFDWGDGSPKEESDSPKATHEFARPAGADASFTVTISTVGPDGCSSSKSATFVVPGICPIARIAESGISYPSDLLAQADVRIEVVHQDGMTYAWLWGDGSDAEVTTTPTHTHRYTRGVEQETYKFSVRVIGPGTCESTLESSVSVDPKPCPTIISVDAGDGSMNGDVFEVPFSVKVRGEGVSAYTWDFGDGSPTVTTSKPEVTHGFNPGAGVETSRTVSVTADGPGASCQSTSTTTVTIPGQCPIASPELKIGTITDTTVEIVAHLRSVGPTPEAWTIDWGDGSTPETVAQGTASHIFTRPGGDQEELTIGITASGPGSCTSNHSLKAIIPGVCPVLVGIQTSGEITEGGQYTLTATVTGSGPTPDQYIWNWGDGTTTTEGATAVHSFQGKPGAEQK